MCTSLEISAVLDQFMETPCQIYFYTKDVNSYLYIYIYVYVCWLEIYTSYRSKGTSIKYIFLPDSSVQIIADWYTEYVFKHSPNLEALLPWNIPSFNALCLYTDIPGKVNIGWLPVLWWVPACYQWDCPEMDGTSVGTIQVEFLAISAYSPSPYIQVHFHIHKHVSHNIFRLSLL